VVNNQPTPTKFSKHFGDGEESVIRNNILLHLPPDEYKKLFPVLEFVRFQSHHVLHEPGDTLKSAFFCETGLISMLSVFSDGKAVEVGLVGREGFVGLPLVAGFRTAVTRAEVQIDATLFRVDSETLTTILPQCPRLERLLQQSSQVRALQVTQLAACNQLHEVEERLARFLLMSTDCIGSDSVALTHEVLAKMLGTRRSGVTMSAGNLERAGAVICTRGNVKIIDRNRLEAAACECYGLTQQHIKNWQNSIVTAD
jgi:CRP-like cAMP-binding protein